MALHQTRITEMIIWLLKKRLISQLHTYVTLGKDRETEIDKEVKRETDKGGQRVMQREKVSPAYVTNRKRHT